MNTLLSIIVPIYNAESFVRPCLDIIARQGLKTGSYEVILVDDGSTDGSPLLADSAAARLPGVRVIHQENRGAGAARNAGLAAARGTYTYFFDVDDDLEDGALARLLDTCLQEELDVLFFGAELVYASEEDRRLSTLDAAYFERRQEPGVIDGETMLVRQQRERNFCAQPCVLMCRTDFLREENVRFAEGIINEDNIFVLLATIRARRTAVDPHPYYRYILRQGSVTLTNAAGFKRFDAHMWLAHEFELEAFKAEAAGKPELANAIAELADLLIGKAFEAYLGIEGDVPAPRTTDMLSRRIVDLFGQIKGTRRELEAANNRIREIESSTTWKVGRAVTAPLRAAKDALRKQS